MIEGWTSGNNDIDKFIKDTIYDARYRGYKFINWVPFNRFKDIKQIGEGGFAKIYSATWIDGEAEYEKQDDRSWKKREPEPMEVALKRLKIHWKFIKEEYFYSVRFYGITKDPETEEFMMILDFAQEGNLRSFLSSNFNKILWKDKVRNLFWIAANLNDLHGLGYSHKDFHSGNISQINRSFISDFGLSGPSNEQKSDDKICGVLPYIAPEVLNKEPYTSSLDIYSFEICNGVRPEFGKGTPEIYKKLAYKCMNANSNQRPTAKELWEIMLFWKNSYMGEYQEELKFGYKAKEIKAIRLFTFNNLTKPVNSSIITSYLDDDENNEDNRDSQLVDLEVSSSLLQSEDGITSNEIALLTK
ncbi:kinase-like domain-containing protein [Rhizophagus diaphanus]|nr:kinase-like domain-containing protein [Rhizophagus diaphanus] [Rhizophagus sp. MUCL 43196]